MPATPANREQSALRSNRLSLRTIPPRRSNHAGMLLDRGKQTRSHDINASPQKTCPLACRNDSDTNGRRFSIRKNHCQANSPESCFCGHFCRFIRTHSRPVCSSRQMPKRFGISIDKAFCRRTMPLLPTKMRRLDARRRSTWTNSRRIAPRTPGPRSRIFSNGDKHFSDPGKTFG